MAFRQELTDRYKAVGFYKHVEWNRKRGVLVKVYDQKPGVKEQTVSFESGTHDLDYDQTLPGFRQFFLERKDAVRFMVNAGFTVPEIAQIFKQIDGMQVVIRQLRLHKH